MSHQSAQRVVDPLLVDEVGHRELLLGNEAIVRGALEAGVAFASGYPGTPSSEVTDTFARISPERGIVFEYSVNEKICLEMAFAASLAGARSICAMKHLGLMVAGDPISTIPYVGVVGGMVIVSAGDPSCRTSPNEQDQRHLGPMLNIPILDPATPQDAYAMTRFAFELSEKSRLPVILRITTRVCHTCAPITFGELREPPSVDQRGFVRDPKRYTPIPINARRMRLDLETRLRTARELMVEANLFRRQGSGSNAILAMGAPAATCSDLLDEHGVTDKKVALWTLGAAYPLPEDELVAALRETERLLVLEELSPYLEDAVRALVAQHDLKTEVLGKRTGHLPVEFEYDPTVIQRGLHEALGLCPEPDAPRPGLHALPRPPSLCPGCPHRAAYFAARVAFPEEQLFFNDIGCYSLGYGPPLNTVDALLCMGAGFTLAAGVSRVTGLRTVGFLGDSTFFHSGMPALLNAIKEQVNMVAVILDNQVTAMTGFQESPSTPSEVAASIEAVVRGLGARQIETVDPYDLSATITAFKRAKDSSGVSVIIVKRACPVYEERTGKSQYGVNPYEVDPNGCRTCGREAAGMRCSEGLTEPYERQLAHTRALQPRGATDAPPSVAPCSRLCPLSICVQGYAGNIAAGDYKAALGQIMSRTPLPESVCRVCHRPCEEACIRRDLDEPVAVNDLKRFVVDWAGAQGSNPYEPERDPDNGMKVAVVGAGPCGLAAAHDLRLRGYAVTLFDARHAPGGLLAYGIPAYRLPPEALERDIQRILDLGVDFVGGRALGRDVTLTELLDGGHDAVFLAVGAQVGRQLDFESDAAIAADRPTRVEALDYLRAVRDGDYDKAGKRVVVIGGGNAAIDAARTARRLGGVEVTIACIEGREQMPALPEEIVAAQREGIGLCTDVRPLRIEGDSIVFGPVGGVGPETRLNTDQIIVAIGQVPAGDFLVSGDPVLQRHDNGCLKVDPESCATSHPRVFAGGDVVVGTDRTVTGAIAWGQRAAWGIDRALRSAKWPGAADRRPPPTRLSTLRVIDAAPPGRRQFMPRTRPLERPLEMRASSFDEVTHVFSEPQAQAEARRCLACGWCGNCRACIDLFGCPAFREERGKAVIDPALCNGCGVCADFCPNGAIRRRGQA